LGAQPVSRALARIAVTPRAIDALRLILSGFPCGLVTVLPFAYGLKFYFKSDHNLLTIDSQLH
jgi:hypothetical protein